jgi:hypothetical protein
MATTDWQSLFRPATRRWPATPEEWDLRPYFVNDYDISWRDLRGYLASEDEDQRAWAVAKVLDGARWSDIWRLITPEDVRDVLGRLPRRLRDMYGDALRAWGLDRDGTGERLRPGSAGPPGA